MNYSQDAELILNSLNKDKRELLDKINEIDKLIKRIKYGNVNLRANRVEDINEDITTPETIEQPQAFPMKAELKVQVIKVFDIIGEATKLKDVQEKYKEITGINHNLRETLRTLNKHDILKLLQPKGTQRGLYWVKSEWLEDNNRRLKEKYKFDGFELLFSDEMIEYK